MDSQPIFTPAIKICHREQNNYGKDITPIVIKAFGFLLKK